ncbi:uncharacterized protein BO72DRAFT_247581 [Aspergillus fijiensis CBS 313.89]|uniref:Uncharacterized protein n=1 Tax=Aspergillus fijiensis CBS 313.89 TaxID=1448319 RepID=A0A8G1RK76_9EURO|nr:uncharacterized protein BO72DRAFT_247581 [Aspergillus fijiensis CBS 313.89]RAK73270.1 hypothetical protein BO72DRAFT_247581 [Aspergillus fijiensis CBS 313.89]
MINGAHTRNAKPREKKRGDQVGINRDGSALLATYPGDGLDNHHRKNTRCSERDGDRGMMHSAASEKQAAAAAAAKSAVRCCVTMTVSPIIAWNFLVGIAYRIRSVDGLTEGWLLSVRYILESSVVRGKTRPGKQRKTSADWEEEGGMEGLWRPGQSPNSPALCILFSPERST